MATAIRLYQQLDSTQGYRLIRVEYSRNGSPIAHLHATAFYLRYRSRTGLTSSCQDDRSPVSVCSASSLRRWYAELHGSMNRFGSSTLPRSGNAISASTFPLFASDIRAALRQVLQPQMMGRLPRGIGKIRAGLAWIEIIPSREKPGVMFANSTHCDGNVFRLFFTAQKLTAPVHVELSRGSDFGPNRCEFQ
jgi:hypothetical protein